MNPKSGDTVYIVSKKELSLFQDTIDNININNNTVKLLRYGLTTVNSMLKNYNLDADTSLSIHITDDFIICSKEILAHKILQRLIRQELDKLDKVTKDLQERYFGCVEKYGEMEKQIEKQAEIIKCLEERK